MLGRIPAADEAALDWFYGPGQALFGQSITGAMLERAALYGGAPPWCSPGMLAAVERRRPNDPPPDACTVRSTGGSYEQVGYVPNEGALRRYASVSRRLDVVSRRDGRAVLVLAAYFGDQGSRWGRSDHGRIFSVWPLTTAGVELLERAEQEAMKRGGANLGLSAVERIGVEVQLQRVRPVAARRRLLDRARREAWMLYGRACDLWILATPQPPEKKT